MSTVARSSIPGPNRLQRFLMAMQPKAIAGLIERGPRNETTKQRLADATDRLSRLADRYAAAETALAEVRRERR